MKRLSLACMPPTLLFLLFLMRTSFFIYTNCFRNSPRAWKKALVVFITFWLQVCLTRFPHFLMLSKDLLYSKPKFSDCPWLWYMNMNIVILSHMFCNKYIMWIQDCEELSEWVQEKNITAQDETYRSAKTVHSKWTRHQAFEAEIASNKDRLFHIQQVHWLFVCLIYGFCYLSFSWHVYEVFAHREFSNGFGW